MIIVSFVHVIFAVSVKPGKPSEDELEELANNIHTEEDYWKRLARRLGIKRPKITAIDDRYKGLSEKAYNMLVHWKQRKGCDATYEVLYEALTNDLVDCKELAEEYCCKK